MISSCRSTQERVWFIGRFDLLTFFFSFIFLLICFWPVLTINYAHHDDWYFFWKPGQPGGHHPQYQSCMQLGRPLAGRVLDLMNSIVDTVSDLRIIRGLSLVTVAILATFLTQRLVFSGLPRWQAWPLSLSVFLLPGMQVYLAWAEFLPACLSLLLATVAALFGDNLPVDSIRAFTKRPIRLKILGWFALLFLSLAIYQPTAMFYMVIVSTWFLFKPQADIPSMIIVLGRHCVLFFLTCSVYFLVYRYVLSSGNSSSVAYAFQLTSDVIQKLSFLIDLSFSALNSWNIRPNLLVFSVTGAIIATGLLAGSWRIYLNSANSSAFVQGIQAGFFRTLAIIGISLLVNTPLLLASWGHAAHRVLFPFTALVVLVVFWSIRSVLGLFGQKGLALGCAGILFPGVCYLGTLAHHQILTGFAANNARGIQFLSDQLEMARHQGREAIQIFPGSPSWVLVGQQRAGVDEFGCSTSSFPQDVPLMVNYLLADLPAEQQPRFLRIGYEDQDSRSRNYDGSWYVIDMGAIPSIGANTCFRCWPLFATGLVMVSWLTIVSRFPPAANTRKQSLKVIPRLPLQLRKLWVIIKLWWHRHDWIRFPMVAILSQLFLGLCAFDFNLDSFLLALAVAYFGALDGRDREKTPWRLFPFLILGFWLICWAHGQEMRWMTFLVLLVLVVGVLVAGRPFFTTFEKRKITLGPVRLGLFIVGLIFFSLYIFDQRARTRAERAYAILLTFIADEMDRPEVNQQFHKTSGELMQPGSEENIDELVVPGALYRYLVRVYYHSKANQEIIRRVSLANKIRFGND